MSSVVARRQPHRQYAFNRQTGEMKHCFGLGGKRESNFDLNNQLLSDPSVLLNQEMTTTLLRLRVSEAAIGKICI